MKPDPLDLPATRQRLEALALNGCLDADTLLRGLQIAGHNPDIKIWARFIDSLLGILGAALVLAGIGFFFAYNWVDMGRFSKFTLLAGLILGAVIIVGIKGLDNKIGKVALFVAAVLTGVLLAVYGQTYQTGADTYSLFLVWALLIVGWVLISRSKALWMLWLVLINLTLIMYWGEVVNPQLSMPEDLIRGLGPLLWMAYLFTDAGLSETVAILNTMALIVYEWFSRCGTHWLNGHWMPRSIASLILIALLIPTLVFIISSSVLQGEDHALKIAPLLYLAGTAMILVYFHTLGHDLFILALSYLSLIVVITAAIGRQLGDNFGGYIFLGLLVITLSTGAAAILRITARARETRHS